MTAVIDTTATYQTTLFAGAAAALSTLSPRAAFQAALHGRIALTDSRDERRRAAEGELPAYLMGSDGGLPVVDVERDVDGGFGAWLSAGMPLARQR